MEENNLREPREELTVDPETMEEEYTSEDFDLEEILREFGDGQQEIQEKTPEEILEAVEREVQEENGGPEETPAEQIAGDTIRLEVIPQAQGEVRDAQKINDEDEAPAVIPAPETGAEPFSEEWEPEYEQPIGEYVPPRILVHPRSRLRELKRKLVAGPEKMYYALMEKGLGKLQAAIFFSLLVVLISAATMAAYALGWVPENRLRLMVFGQFLAMLVCALLGYNQLLAGAAELLHKKFSLNTLLLFSFVLCCADGVIGLMQLRLPCCAAFSLQVTMSLWSTYHRRNIRMGQLDTMRKATRLDSICPAENYYEELKGLLRGEGQVEHFMETMDEPSGMEKILSVYSICALCVSVALGVTAGVLHGYAVGIQVAAVTLLAAVPASVFVTLSRPFCVLEQRMHRLGTVICGWQGVNGLCGKVVFPLDHNDLFPAGTVRMNGVKFFGDREPDEIIAYATALVELSGGALQPLFTHLLDSRNGMHYPVVNFRGYDNGGIGGEVNSEPVLVGTLSFLREMGVEVPEELRVSHAVCAAVDGELCGLFALSYQKDRYSAAGLATLSSYRGLIAVLTGGDFMLTDGFVRRFFDVKTKRIRFPEPTLRQELREAKPEPDAPAYALITGEGLAPFAYAVTGARALRSACRAGLVIHMVGGMVGIAMMAVLAVLGATEYLTPVNMFLYQLLWMIPGLLVTGWTRSV